MKLFWPYRHFQHNGQSLQPFFSLRVFDIFGITYQPGYSDHFIILVSVIQISLSCRLCLTEIRNYASLKSSLTEIRIKENHFNRNKHQRKADKTFTFSTFFVVDAFVVVEPEHTLWLSCFHILTSSVGCGNKRIAE